LSKPYLCPICRQNKTSFELLFKLTREIRKDPKTGAVLYQASELACVMRNGQPEIDIRCLHCGYTGYERLFIKAAQQDVS
jgi:hypothetical protein